MTTPTKETPSTAHLDYVDNSSSESPERVSKWVYAAIFSMGLGVGCNVRPVLRSAAWRRAH